MNWSNIETRNNSHQSELEYLIESFEGPEHILPFTLIIIRILRSVCSLHIIF